MLKRIFDTYKVPLLLSITLAIALIALNVIREPFEIAWILLGTLLGTFFLDLDYIIYAYFTDTDNDFSKSLRGFAKHNDWSGVLQHIYYHKNEIKEKTLNSALFQIILAGVTVFTVNSEVSFFFKAFVLSAFLNSIYRFIENYFIDKSLSDWFWSLNFRLNKNGLWIYTFAIALVLLYCLNFFGL